MFIGHYGPVIWDTQRGAGRPIVRLWEAFLAVQAIDILCAGLIIFGLEGTALNEHGKPVFDIPWSHSLISALALSGLVGGLFRLVRPQSGARGFWVVAALVFSHWVLDLVVHRPDLALYPGGDHLLGLGFWDYPYAAFALEAGLLFAALFYWQRVTTAKSRIYDIGIWALFAFMVVMHVGAIVMPGLQVQNGTFDISAAPQGPMAGMTMLIALLLFALLIGLIERGRPAKVAG